MIVDFADI